MSTHTEDRSHWLRALNEDAATVADMVHVQALWGNQHRGGSRYDPALLALVTGDATPICDSRARRLLLAAVNELARIGADS
jgi:hypothetical protein